MSNYNSNALMPSVSIPHMPEIQSRNVPAPVYNIDNRITVEGVATDQIVNGLEKVVQNANKMMRLRR